MKVIKVNSLYQTEREVDCPKGGFKSLRVLLEQDGMGYTVTKTIIPKGEPQFWHYKNHYETCFCIAGRGVLTNLANNTQYTIEPDSVYVLDRNDPHTFQAIEDTVLICVFNPPLKGREVHKSDGSY
jgi:L-ectoine synthase